MKNTKHQTRLEKLAKVAKVLELLTDSVNEETLDLRQQVSLSLSIGEVQAKLNQLRVWSTLS